MLSIYITYDVQFSVQSTEQLYEGKPNTELANSFGTIQVEEV